MIAQPSAYERLAGAAGQALLAGLSDFTEDRLTDAVAYARSHADPDVAAAAVATAFARRRARSAGKFSQPDLMLFTRTGYEQATSEAVARHRATRFNGFGSVTDLCCGIGSDAIAIAGRAAAVVAVDSDADAVSCARANAGALGVADRVSVQHADALTFPLSGCDAAFADPSRRQGGARVRGGHRYAPPLHALLARAAALPGRRLALKTAPGLDFDHPGIRAALGAAPLEVELVSERGTCKEAVLWCGEFARVDGARRATVIDGYGVHVLDGDPTAAAPARKLGAFVGEPDPAVIRAGLIAAACANSGAGPLDSRVAYLTADAYDPTPFVRWFQLVEALPFNVKHVRERLRAHDIGELVVKVRAFPLAPEDVIALLKPQGEARAVLICTTVGEKKWAMVCGTVGP